jgi:hypothetical protein
MKKEVPLSPYVGVFGNMVRYSFGVGKGLRSPATPEDELLRGIKRG